MSRAASESMADRSGESHEHRSASTNEVAVGCLVWSTGSDSLPASVRQSLERRQVTIALTQSPTEVMVQLGRSPTNLLMLVNPETLPDCSLAIAAIRKYYPQIIFWQCSCSLDGPVKLTRWSDDSAGFTQTESSLSPERPALATTDFTFPPSKSQPLRPSGRIPYPGTKAQAATRKSRLKPAPSAAHLQLDAGPLLTREELEMLLNDESAMRADRSPLSDDGL